MLKLAMNLLNALSATACVKQWGVSDFGDRSLTRRPTLLTELNRRFSNLQSDSLDCLLSDFQAFEYRTAAVNSNAHNLVSVYMEGLRGEVVDTGSLNYLRESQSPPTLLSVRLGSFD